MRLAGIIAILSCAALSAADWTEWRSPHRDGVLNAEPKSWPEKLNVKWKVEVGEGHASPILVGSTIYDFARADNQETLYAINLADGKVRWKQQYAATAKVSSAADGHGPGPKSTPLYANGKVYTLGLGGILSAWDAETGKANLAQGIEGVQSPESGVRRGALSDHRQRETDRASGRR